MTYTVFKSQNTTLRCCISMFRFAPNYIYEGHFWTDLGKSLPIKSGMPNMIGSVLICDDDPRWSSYWFLKWIQNEKYGSHVIYFIEYRGQSRQRIECKKNKKPLCRLPSNKDQHHAHISQWNHGTNKSIERKGFFLMKEKSNHEEHNSDTY